MSNDTEKYGHLPYSGLERYKLRAAVKKVFGNEMKELNAKIIRKPIDE